MSACLHTPVDLGDGADNQQMDETGDWVIAASPTAAWMGFYEGEPCKSHRDLLHLQPRVAACSKSAPAQLLYQLSGGLYPTLRH